MSEAQEDERAASARATRAGAGVLNVGIIGAGNISDFYLRIGRGFSNFAFTAIADLDTERAAAKAEAHGVQATTVTELLADDAIDVVVNLTVPAAHAAVSRAVLGAGKHVYSEKPLATSREDGKAILALAAARGLLVGCAPDTFLGAGLQAARAAIDAGLIGEPIAASAFMMSSGPDQWHPDPAFFFAPGAGPLFDMGPYYLTALINLFGPVSQVSGSAVIGRRTRPIMSAPRKGQLLAVETPTHVSAQLEFASGKVVTLLTSFDCPASELPKCEVYGTEATLSLPDPNTFGGSLKLRRTADKEWQTLPLSGPYTENSRGLGLADMVDALAAGRRQRAGGELAFHVLDTMVSILEASETRAWQTLASSCERPAALAPGTRY
ncbi:MAG TPA: Gfo/Idh/MocA family oxidoreductase [Trueperaceae bacterium]|nr:Gfo/Idh/MocA family oxidoreductase [Trueperaceae bacterium]